MLKFKTRVAAEENLITNGKNVKKKRKKILIPPVTFFHPDDGNFDKIFERKKNSGGGKSYKIAPSTYFSLARSYGLLPSRA